VSHPVIDGILKKNKITLNSSRKYFCNEFYFQEINSEDKAYFHSSYFDKRAGICASCNNYINIDRFGGSNKELFDCKD
jgi:hypothetical protein